MNAQREPSDLEEHLAILQNQLLCLQRGLHVDDLGNDITMNADQIQKAIERLLQQFQERE